MNKNSKWVRGVMIVLLVAGVISLLGGSYLTLMFTDQTNIPTVTPVVTSTDPGITVDVVSTTVSTTGTSTPNVTVETIPLEDSIYQIFKSADSKFSMDQPKNWTNADVALFSLSSNFSGQKLLGVKDTEKSGSLLASKYTADKTIKATDIWADMDTEMTKAGWQGQLLGKYADGYTETAEFSYVKNKETIRLQSKVIVNNTGDKKTAYLINFSASEKDYQNGYLGLATHIIGSAKAQ